MPSRLRQAEGLADPARAGLSGDMLTVAALYQFTRFPDPAALQEPLLALCRSEGITGTLILAREGINSTIAGAQEDVHAILDYLRREY